eukprot:15355622-Ditylum_brightwellii.AAC.1
MKENGKKALFSDGEEPTGKQKTCVQVFLTIISALHLNTIKFDATIYNQLLKHNLYIKPDMFKHNNVVSPGQITCQQPKLICQEDFIAEITADMGIHPPPDNDITAQWHKDDNKAFSTNTSVTHFNLAINKEKYGNGMERVEANMFKIL